MERLTLKVAVAFLKSYSWNIDDSTNALAWTHLQSSTVTFNPFSLMYTIAS